jgi:hypothetical protein
MGTGITPIDGNGIIPVGCWAIPITPSHSIILMPEFTF